jgi:hypothetical protein
MKENRAYDSFSAAIVVPAILVSVSIYVIGAYILKGIGVWLSILYVLYCAWIEFRILKYSCADCYYYGKFCGLGRGKLCSLLFKKGDPQRFINKEVSWYDLLPDFMVSLFPLIGGIILLIKDFNWLLLLLLVIMLALSFGGNAIIRGSFACKYCKQREIGCPAERLFNKQSQPTPS